MLRPLLVVALLAAPAYAQPGDAKANEAAVKKQQALAIENLKVLRISKPTLVETAHLLVYADMPEEKLKPIADGAEAAFERGFKDLKYGEKDRLWDGKLTVYVLADRTKEYTPFVKLVEQRSGKLNSQEMRTHAIKGEPYVAVTAAPGSRTAEADLKAEAMIGVAAALLDQKAGGAAPSWLTTGAGTAISLRSKGNERAMAAHRGKTRALFTRTKVGFFQVGDVWGGNSNADVDTLTVSLGEYLVYGADSAATAKFLSAFRPNEDRQSPDVNDALNAAEWKVEALDAAWKQWVYKQR